ncbi:MAG TPA: hypothetical protein VKV16_11750 [Solirubrobacteraceae bacterium]|nr:hypothetical protein [Solirubrobacteraceae bacterium]
MPTSAIILSVAILAGVLLSDLGRRAVTPSRLRRPLIVAGVAGATYLTAFATSGTALAVELAGAGAGTLLGLLAAALLRVEHEPDGGRAYTRAGVAYALVWLATVGARLAFIYGSQHWFSASLGSWLHANHVSADALTDALVLMALAMACARTLSLFARARVLAPGSPAAPLDVEDARACR